MHSAKTEWNIFKLYIKSFMLGIQYVPYILLQIGTFPFYFVIFDDSQLYMYFNKPRFDSQIFLTFWLNITRLVFSYNIMRLYINLAHLIVLKTKTIQFLIEWIMHCVRRIIYWYWNSLILFSIILFILSESRKKYLPSPA